MPNLDRAEIARLLAAATPGPWSHSTVGLTNEGQRPISTEYGRVALADCQTEAPKKSLWQTDCATREANAALIALARPLACVYVDGPLGAEAMKQAAALAVRRGAPGSWLAREVEYMQTYILALPSPSPADLLTAALALPEVWVLVDLLTELRDHKPTVFSGRAHDPQDDVDDMMPLAEFEAFQEDATKLLAALGDAA